MFFRKRKKDKQAQDEFSADNMFGNMNSSTFENMNGNIFGNVSGDMAGNEAGRALGASVADGIFDDTPADSKISDADAQMQIEALKQELRKQEMLKEEMLKEERLKQEALKQELHKQELLKEELLRQGTAKQEMPVTIDRNEAVKFVKENCEAISENEKQIAEAKQEYEKVTSDLTDIQRIEMAPDDQRQEILDTCKEILSLTSERKKYKDSNFSITDAQVRKFEPFEDGLVDEIKKMYNAESYQTAIESDISNLKKEKDSLYSQRKEIEQKQNAIKRMTKVLALLIGSLIVLLIVIFYALKADMTLPYLGVVFLAGVSAAALIYESSKNRRDVIITEKKINKAVTLLNKVKIKYINNINVLDYNCKKYGVENAKDFEQKWNEYCKMREYEKKFRQNTEMLNADNENLLLMLKDIGVVETDVWLSRCAAIVDQKEMVEIRHELNQRRQMIRERIENNEKIKEDIIKQLDHTINSAPNVRDELIQVVRNFNETNANA